MSDSEEEHVPVPRGVKFTKSGRPDRRSLTSRTNAEKARNQRSVKRQEKKVIVEPEETTDSSDDEEDELVLVPRKKVEKPKKVQEVKAPPITHDELVETLTKTVAKTLKMNEQERKTKAKAKREAVKKAKAEGTYVPQTRGRPVKHDNVEQKAQPEIPAPKPTGTYISW